MGKKKHSKKHKGEKGLLGNVTQPLPTQHNIKNSAIETGKDLLVGVLGGGVVGAAIGRASLAIGAVVTGISHYAKSSLGRIFGIGMMASSGFSKPSGDTVSGTDSGNTNSLIDGAKERMLNFKDSITHKLYLDKLLQKKQDSGGSTDTNTQTSNSGKAVGDVQHFVYPYSGELDMSSLDKVENDLQQSATDYQQNNGASGLGRGEELDPEERNY